MNIGFVGCAPAILKKYFPTRAEPNLIPTEPFYTPDDQLAVNALRAQGHKVLPICWGASIDNLLDVQLIIIRSPWDYMDSNAHQQAFSKWLQSLETAGLRLANPVPFMEWLLDKHYLMDIQQQGVAVIPTQYLARGAFINLAAIFTEHGQFILKPCVSAAGMGLFHIHSLAQAQQLQLDMQARFMQCEYMLQDFVPEISSRGEWSLIFFGGKYSHAVHKQPAADSIFVHAERGGALAFITAPKHVIAFAELAFMKILTAFKKVSGHQYLATDILYLRLDILETKNGPVVMECEGVEPELFFRAHPGSEQQFCSAVNVLLLPS